MKTVTIDFETEAIIGNPLVNPPKPVGVSIKIDDKPSQYFTEDMKDVLEQVWEGDHSLVFHNAPFDISVAVTWLGMSLPEWFRVHDTTLLVYLENPHATSLSLKPSAERVLGIEPEERDELREWIIKNVKKATTKTWGAYICEAPVELVEEYAKADTDLTYALYEHLKDAVPKEAYDLERELQPHLTKATQTGIRVDRHALQRAEWEAYRSLTDAENRIQDMLCCHFDVHKGEQLADALDSAGKISKWTLTPTGKRSTSRANLEAGIDDQELLALLSYAGVLRTCLNTFIRGWLTLSDADERLHPSWNQVRGVEYGTRTGRLSCSQPNLQNVPKPFTLRVPDGLSPVPEMRSFLLPEPGCVWVSRDFSAQEVRLLAHFEGGVLMDAFRDNPALDPHQLVVVKLRNDFKIDITRAQAKTIAFGIIYGMGVPGMAAKMGIDILQADELINGYHAAFPGVANVQQGTKARGQYDTRQATVRKLNRRIDKANERGLSAQYIDSMKASLQRAEASLPPCNYVETVGGRQYKVEPPKLIDNRMRTFEYKLMNYLIQGSAADQTKRALLAYFRANPTGETFLCTVHDEINISSLSGDSKVLKHSMEYACNEGISTPMLTTLETGPTWGDIQ